MGAWVAQHILISVLVSAIWHVVDSQLQLGHKTCEGICLSRLFAWLRGVMTPYQSAEYGGLWIVLLQVQAEQTAVVAKHGSTLTPEAYADMPYSMAVVKETLRLAQIIPNVPRIATKELQVPGGPTLPAGCPFVVAFEAIGRSDPALQKLQDGGQFNPERCASQRKTCIPTAGSWARKQFVPSSKVAAIFAAGH